MANTDGKILAVLFLEEAGSAAALVHGDLQGLVNDAVLDAVAESFGVRDKLEINLVIRVAATIRV